MTQQEGVEVWGWGKWHSPRGPVAGSSQSRAAPGATDGVPPISEHEDERNIEKGDPLCMFEKS